MKSGILRADEDYLDRLKGYTLRDTLIAIGYYALILAVYYVMGWVNANTGKYYGVPASILLMLIPVALCRGPAPLGLCGKNLKRSLIVSGVLGAVILLSISIVPGILSHARLLPIDRILRNILYYFIIIALSEEISFRGFIQPRLFPVAKSEWLTLLLGGVLFVFMHYPYQMAARGMTFGAYWPLFIQNAPMQFIWHLAFSALYRRYGNLFAGTLLHGCVDMSMGLFA